MYKLPNIVQRETKMQIRASNYGKLNSRVLVGLISSNVRTVDLLTEYSNDADEEYKVHLWRKIKCCAYNTGVFYKWDIVICL